MMDDMSKCGPLILNIFEMDEWDVVKYDCQPKL